MAPDDLAMLAATTGVLVVCIVVAAVVRYRRRDEIFAGVTPGLTPAAGMPERTVRVGGASGAYDGPVAVQFTPPPGLTAGIVGTLVDGRADLRDVTAALFDLAVRGALTITAVPPASEGGKPDWRLTLVQRDGWADWESALLRDLFGGRDVVLMSGLTQGRFGQAMREAQVELYRGVVGGGYYRSHPRAKNARVAMLGYLVVAIGIGLLGFLGFTWSQRGSWYGWMGGALVLAGGVVLALTGRGRTPRTALGTARRIQALGFKEYLVTAEADRIRFEEAQQIFSRYLPYAIAFGVADRWATTFAEVARRARADGVGLAWTDLGYLDLGPLLEGGAALVDLADLGALGGDASDLWNGLGLPDGDFGDLVGGVADFVGSGTDLALPDGCDGCDLGGCDGCG